MRSLKVHKTQSGIPVNGVYPEYTVSFACSVGLDMGFNKGHHADEKKTKGHSHGRKHAHGAASESKHSHSGHSHATAPKYSNDLAIGGEKNQDQKDNCCNETNLVL